MGRKATKTPEELAAARTKYKNTWQRENKDRIPITVPAGDKDRIAAWAKSRGYPSTNAYITDLVYKDMVSRNSLNLPPSSLLAMSCSPPSFLYQYNMEIVAGQLKS